MHKWHSDSIGGGFVRKKICHTIFDTIISVDNLFSAWREFRRGKRKKIDVQNFEFALEDNLFTLHEELITKTYEHSGYQSFYVQDPKLRHIHKAVVRDRVVHQAVFRVLYPIFDKGFIHDSYSCRIQKGTHRAVNRLASFARKASHNNTKILYALKCDIKKFFDSVDHATLLLFIKERVDEDTMWLVEHILKSFEKENGRGLPLGNVTSQLFANVYLHALDMFVKQNLREKYYLRYCDDFIILGNDLEHLSCVVKEIDRFLCTALGLRLHKNKVSIRKYGQGIDFLGYVIRPYYRVLRTKTKRRMFREMKKKKILLSRGVIDQDSFDQSRQSYLGMLSHCKGFILRKRLSAISEKE